jgi:hypothetical protein
MQTTDSEHKAMEPTCSGFAVLASKNHILARGLKPTKRRFALLGGHAGFLRCGGGF